MKHGHRDQLSNMETPFTNKPNEEMRSILMGKKLTFDMSQAIIDGSFETRSMEKTLLFTFLARQASPEIHDKMEKGTNITSSILMDA